LQEIMDALGAGDMGPDEGDDELAAAEEAGGGSNATKAASGNGVGAKGTVRVTRFISVQVQVSGSHYAASRIPPLLCSTERDAVDGICA
jgi:hypothetical protein